MDERDRRRTNPKRPDREKIARQKVDDKTRATRGRNVQKKKRVGRDSLASEVGR